MDDWFCIAQEPIAARRTRARTSQTKAGEFASNDTACLIVVPLRPEDSLCGRLRPPSRLQMNSQRSALTAALAGLTDSQTRAKKNCEGASPAQNSTVPVSGAGESPFPLDKDLSWMPLIVPFTHPPPGSGLIRGRRFVT